VNKLVQGVHQFQHDVFRPRHQFFERLAQAQHPQALFITCSDSRMIPDLITQADPGDLFVVRNVGNIVPAYGTGGGTEAAAIEYAVKALKVEDIIVCGHTRCGAIHGMLHPENLTDLPRVGEWLRHTEACKETMACRYAHLQGDVQWEVAVKENVLTQLDNLRTHPAVASRLSAGSLKLHAWVYNIESGSVQTYDPDLGDYRVLEKPDGKPVVSPVMKRAKSARLTLAGA
jgi:carbonic anhydrase